MNENFIEAPDGLIYKLPLFAIRILANGAPVRLVGETIWIPIFTNNSKALEFLGDSDFDENNVGLTELPDRSTVRFWIEKWSELFPDETLAAIDLVDDDPTTVTQIPLWDLYYLCKTTQ